MIKDARVAKSALRLLTKAKAPLERSLVLVRANCSAEEYDEYARAMSHVLGRIFFLLENPIFCQHPSTAPAGFPKSFIKAWAKARGNSGGAAARDARANGVEATNVRQKRSRQERPRPE